MTKRQFLVLVTTILGSTVVIVDGVIVNLALPKIGADLHVGFSGLQWMVDGYLLSLSALILLGGSLGDILGRKKIYLIGAAGFGVSSLLCGLAPTATMLILFRVVQGIFGALLVPGALSIINTNIGRKDRGQAIGRWTGWTSVGVVIAPLLGGLILGITTWRWIFLVNIPLLLSCVLIGAGSIEESKDAHKRHIDFGGAALAVAALASLTFGLIEGPIQHWNVLTIGALVAGVVLSLAFVLFEAWHPDPMVPLHLFKSRNFSGSNLMTFAMYGALSGFTFALVIYLQKTLGYSSIKAGASLLPISIIMFFFAGRVGKLAAKKGPRLFMTLGPLIAAVGIASFYWLDVGSAYVTGVLPGVLLFSIGLALTVAPLTTTVMTSIDETASGIASGVNNAVSRVAGLIVVATLGVLGANSFYQFSIALSAALAAVAGIISFLVIQNFKTRT